MNFVRIPEQILKAKSHMSILMGLVKVEKPVFSTISKICGKS